MTGAGRPPPPPTCASSRGCAPADTRSRRSSAPARTDSSRSVRSRTCSAARGRASPCAKRSAQRLGRRSDRADLRRPWGWGWCPRMAFTEEDVQMLKYGAAVLDAGLPLPAFLQLMRVYGQARRSDRRRRGAADPPLRARAADARRRAERGDRGGDGGARARGAAVRDAVHELPARAAARAVRRAGHDRPHGEPISPRTPSRRAACGWRSRSPTSPAMRG